MLYRQVFAIAAASASERRGVRFRIKFGLDWQKMGQILIWDFLRSVSQNEQKSDFKKSPICPTWCQSGPIGDKIGHLFVRGPGMSNLASKLGQIGPKWDKSGTF